jgi:hypothetical protein
MRDHRRMSDPPPMRRRGRALLAGIVTVVALLALSASPAHAHAADAGRASNYETSLQSVPDVPGLDVSVVDAGTTIELVYRGDSEIVVLGYSGEPYLRISPRGVEQNRRSPAAYLNRSLTTDTPLPPEADPHAAPAWEQVSSEPVARWHDHRAHWMGTIDPPAVQVAPDERHVVVEDAEIPLLIGGIDGAEEAIVVDLTWVPGPSPWPWVAGIAVTVAGLALAGVTRAAGAVTAAVTTMLVLVGAAAIVVATTAAILTPPVWWVASIVLAMTALIVGLVLRRGERQTGARALLGIGGLAVAGLVGAIDRAWLVRSRPASTLRSPGS